MNKTEFILETAEGNEVAAKLINPMLNVNFNDGAVQIGGSFDIKSVSGRDMIMVAPFDQYSIRLGDLESPTTAVLTDAQQTILESKKAIFQTLLDTVKTATQTAALAIYQLNNPAI